MNSHEMRFPTEGDDDRDEVPPFRAAYEAQ
jgi:hypothetical protein